MKGEFDKIPAEIVIKHYRNLKLIHVDNIKPKEITESTRGIWIWGPPGSGKTHHGRTMYGEDIYIKS